jgi:hypothetical protein
MESGVRTGTTAGHVGGAVVGLFECLACGGESFHAISVGEETNFRCTDCGACWHLEFGWVSPVDPTTCPGCPLGTECGKWRSRAS